MIYSILLYLSSLILCYTDPRAGCGEYTCVCVIFSVSLMLDNDGIKCVDYKRPCTLLNDTNRTVGLYLINLDRTMGQNGGNF